MTTAATLAGWICIVLALYVPSALAVAGATAVVVRISQHRIVVPGAAIAAIALVVAALLWSGIPILVHARFGRAGY